MRRGGFTETEVLTMSETAFLQYVDILHPDAGAQAGVKRFKNAGRKKT